MWLLLRDIVRRRYRWASALMAVSVAGVWTGAQLDAEGASWAFGMSLGFVFVQGPLSIAVMPAPRAIWCLPASRRDLWRATWMAATAIPTIVTTAGKLASLLLPGGSLGIVDVLLSSTYDFAYAGIGCGMVVVNAWRTPPRGLRRYLTMACKGICACAFAGGALWGFGAFRGWLPVHWSGLTFASGTMVAGSLVLALATYFHVPGPGTRTGRSLVTRPTRKASGEVRAVSSRSRRRAGLTGLPRLLLHEYLWSTLLAGLMVVGAGIAVFVVGALKNSPESYGGVMPMLRLLLLDAALAEQRGRVFDLIVWCAVFSATMSRIPDIIRHLRVLPVAAARLNMLLVAWPAAMMLTIWVGLVGLHYTVLGRPETALQPAWVVALIGSSAIGRAMQLRWPSLAPWPGILWLCAGGMLRLLDGRQAAALLVLGLGGIVAAAALNHYTLRRSATYRRPQPAEVSPAGPW
jgi:hypothetical protein